MLRTNVIGCQLIIQTLGINPTKSRKSAATTLTVEFLIRPVPTAVMKHVLKCTIYVFFAPDGTYQHVPSGPKIAQRLCISSCYTNRTLHASRLAVCGDDITTNRLWHLCVTFFVTNRNLRRMLQRNRVCVSPEISWLQCRDTSENSTRTRPNFPNLIGGILQAMDRLPPAPFLSVSLAGVGLLDVLGFRVWGYGF